MLIILLSIYDERSLKNVHIFLSHSNDKNLYSWKGNRLTKVNKTTICNGKSHLNWIYFLKELNDSAHPCM